MKINFSGNKCATVNYDGTRCPGEMEFTDMVDLGESSYNMYNCNECRREILVNRETPLNDDED